MRISLALLAVGLGSVLLPLPASAQWAGSPDLEVGLDANEVELFDDFERDGFQDDWITYWNSAPGPDTVSDPAYVFAGERALVLQGSSGEHYSSGAGEFAPWDGGRGDGPDTLYLRVYLRLEDGFSLGSCNQLKLFGLKAGATMEDTYGGAGEPPDGTDKASVILSVDNDMAFHFYTYYPDQSDMWGDYMYLDVGGQAYLEPGRWFLIEVLLALNTPGQNDGEIRGWIDGDLKGDVQNLRFRDVDDVVIRRFEIENYFGGDGPENTSPSNQRAFYDNVVVSTGPIGAYAGPGGGDGDADADADSDADVDADADADEDRAPVAGLSGGCRATAAGDASLGAGAWLPALCLALFATLARRGRRR